MKQLVLGRDVREPIISVVMDNTVVTPGETSRSCSMRLSPPTPIPLYHLAGWLHPGGHKMRTGLMNSTDLFQSLWPTGIQLFYSSPTDVSDIVFQIGHLLSSFRDGQSVIKLWAVDCLHKLTSSATIKQIKKNTVLLMLSFSPSLHPFFSLCKRIYQDTNSYNDSANISEHKDRIFKSPWFT